MSMSQYEQGIGGYYGGLDFEAAILDAVRAAGGSPEALAVKDLGSLDQLHSGGSQATLALANFASVRGGEQVLDVGSGLGGPARTLAATFNCQVIGLDLSAGFCRAAERLTQRMGLADRVRFQHGNALDMPFADASFDIVWMHNTGMNIPDKERLYREIHRVLRPGGRYVLSEAMAGPVQPLHFPVPWASEASLSFLRAADEIRALLQAVGLTEVAWVDRTAQVLAEQQTRAREGGGPGNIFALRWGTDAPAIRQNIVRNLAEGRIVEIQALLERRRTATGE